jgi:hypothetical protein
VGGGPAAPAGRRASAAGDLQLVSATPRLALHRRRESR